MSYRCAEFNKNERFSLDLIYIYHLFEKNHCYRTIIASALQYARADDSYFGF